MVKNVTQSKIEIAVNVNMTVKEHHVCGMDHIWNPSAWT